MMTSFYLPIAIWILLLGCSLFSEEPNDFVSIFKAEINGEQFDLSNKSKTLTEFNNRLTNQGSGYQLDVSGILYNEELFPYGEFLGFLIKWEEGVTEYSAKSDTVNFGNFNSAITGGSYIELDGDVFISTYASRSNESGLITVNFEELDNGKSVIYGTFEFKAVKNARNNSFSLRVGQDTLRITNGVYRLLLDDRR